MNRTDEYILGVDAGNTKTIALIADRQGRILGKGRAGCGDIYGVGSVEAAFIAVDGAVSAALAELSISGGQIAAGGFSMAGADWPEDYVELRETLLARGYGPHVTVVNDALGALRAGSPDGNGTSIVCGTGTAIGARNADRLWHTSFWQDNVCSAWSLGSAALRAVYDADLGILPPTQLTQRILTHYRADTVESLLHRFTHRKAREHSHAGKLACVLLDTADAGDMVAVSQAEMLATSVADYALVCARKVGIKEGQLFVLSGGVFRHPSRILEDTILRRVQSEYPDSRVLRSTLEPAIGAVMLGFEAAGATITDAVRSRLMETMPEANFFSTLNYQACL